MAKPQMMLPSSTGGIMRYFSDYKSKILIKPGHVIFTALALIIIVVMLHALTP